MSNDGIGLGQKRRNGGCIFGAAKMSEREGGFAASAWVFIAQSGGEGSSRNIVRLIEAVTQRANGEFTNGGIFGETGEELVYNKPDLRNPWFICH